MQYPKQLALTGGMRIYPLPEIDFVQVRIVVRGLQGLHSCGLFKCP
jgi:hypothetical protein